jgi:hypothetical protein
MNTCPQHDGTFFTLHAGDGIVVMGEEKIHGSSGRGLDISIPFCRTEWSAYYVDTSRCFDFFNRGRLRP